MIPLKIETLLEGKVVEKNRVEYKEGWNPSDIIHTICAFANDYDNVNGGYIVIGVAAKDGIPILPPVGIKPELLDNIQQEIFQYCNRIEPRYIPNIEVVEFPDQDTHLIYLKCSAGDAGPYQAPVDVYSKKGKESGDKKPDKTMKYWIRPASLTVAAKNNEISELYEKFNSIPYDDRINRMATLDIIRRGFVEDFLRDSNSSLVNEINNRSIEDLLISLEVANETDTDLAIRNIGILMFAERPDKYIPGAQINLVKFEQGKVRARKYRNRRIGEFFKELDLSEKQSTGIPTILSELKKNGSPMPVFDTDSGRNYLETTIKVRDGFDLKENFNQKNERSLSEVLSEVIEPKIYEKIKKIIFILQEKGTITPKEAEQELRKSPATIRRYMKLLVETEYVTQEGNTNSIIYKNILF
ncbi:MAG: putative DNA binding domain-containing protein [Eubacteriales bacterium]